MNTEAPAITFLHASLINNFVLSSFLGICPFLGVSGRVSTALRMGLAVAVVMLISSLSAYGLNALLIALEAPYLRLISYIVVIASAVQLVELITRRFSPALFQALGIYLPLITTNCAILGLALFQTSRQYDFVHSIAYALGAGAGFILALLLMSGIREELSRSRQPSALRGLAIVLIVAGILALAFMGFAGLGSGQL